MHQPVIMAFVKEKGEWEGGRGWRERERERERE